jgi:recombination protein RecA
MSRTKKATSEQVVLDDLSSLATATGGNILRDCDHAKYYIDTGSLAMNYIVSGKFIGGGVPGGKIIEFYGPSSSGKSYWGTNILRGTQAIDGIPIYLDCENAMNSEFAAAASHIDISKIIRYTPDTLEKVFSKIYNVIRAVREKFPDKPLVFVYDSLSASPCERELRETNLDEEYTKAEWKRVVGAKEQPGERAKICSKEFRKLETLLDKTNTTLVVINQTRMKIGVMYGNPETTGGGLALEFYAGVRLRTQAQKRIETKEFGSIIGVNLKVQNKKNRCSTPFKEAEGIQLFFDKGVNPISGVLGILEQSRRIQRVNTKGLWKVNEPWAGGQEITFTATLGKGITSEALLKCPAMVDATEDELRNYLAIFEGAINAGNSEDIVEKEVKDDSLDSAEDEANATVS